MRVYRAVAVLAASTACFGETLVLKNGTSVSGSLVGMDSREFALERCGRVEYYARHDVSTVQLETERADACTPQAIQIRAGYRIRARTVDYVDSAREPLGQVFLATLDAPVMIDGRTVLQPGARLLLKLIETVGPGGPARALDLIGIELRKSSWVDIPAGTAEIEFDPALTPASFPKISVRGERVLIPSDARLTLVLNRAVKL